MITYQTLIQNKSDLKKKTKEKFIYAQGEHKYSYV